MERIRLDDHLNRESKYHYIVLAGILLVAAYFRTVGLGTHPLAVDEFYIARSVSFILDGGLPAFPCGGYYSRGLLYQYTVAPLLMLGVTPELGVRLVAAVCGMVTVVGSYSIARNLLDSRTALAIGFVIALSLWEIELSRFGRMYAPFQAVFIWYCYHAIRLIRFHEPWRWNWLLGLGFVALFVWEGGIFLSLFNILIIGIFNRSDIKSYYVVIALTTLFAIILRLTNFRFSSEIPALPTNFQALHTTEGTLVELVNSHLGWHAQVLLTSPLTAIVIAVLFVFAIYQMYKLVQSSELPYITGIVMSAITVSASVGYIAVSALAVAASVASGIINRASFKSGAMQTWTCIVFCLVILWLSLALSDVSFPLLLPEIKQAVVLISGWPNVFHAFVRPWLAVAPITFLLVTVGILGSLIFLFFHPGQEKGDFRILTLIVVTSIALVSAIETTNETRYFFFLYPVTWILAGLLFYCVVGQRIWRDSAISITLVLLFLVSADFAPSHLLNIAGYQTNFRQNYSIELKDHLYARQDFRGTAEVINLEAKKFDRIVVTEATLTRYLDRQDNVSIALDMNEPRYAIQACVYGLVERWSNLPLISDVSKELRYVEAKIGDFWLIVEKRRRSRNSWAQDMVDSLPSATELYYISEDESFEIYRYSP